MNKRYKQIDEITSKDFKQYPIWEYLSEDDPNAKDECTVKGHTEYSDEIESMFIVETLFTLKDGTEYIGFIRPEKGLSNSQPVIIIGEDYVYFWSGIREISNDEKEKKYKLLNKKCSDIFPIKYQTKMGLLGFGWN